MAAKALANEAYLEEYNRLELELKQLQHELSDSVVLNDELTKVISQKVHYLCRHSTVLLFLKSFQRTAGGRVADQRQTAGVLTRQELRRRGTAGIGQSLYPGLSLPAWTLIAACPVAGITDSH
jgi:hypothetical protein